MSLDTNVKVMYLNPIGNSDYDETFAQMAKTYKYPATAVDVASMNPASVPPKMNNLEYRTYEAFIIRDTVEAARYAAKNGYDALVIGCFYDPALDDAREISGSTAVVAPCQAACEVALNLANNFSVIIGETKWEDQMRQTVYNYGYKDKLVSFQAVDMRVEDFHKDPDATKAALVDAAIAAVDLHKAESIILGCTLEVGFFEVLQETLYKFFGCNVPVVDCSIAALKAGENAALAKHVGWNPSRVWGMQPPPESELQAFDLLQTDYKFGNVIHVPADS
ncbi:MAG: aspartate/glutamate racemase family protein [Gammaproteobacteria bacterium]|nr:aspartate/glutamate racemase family protein [Gammaproteobacteria bacterium]